MPALRHPGAYPPLFRPRALHRRLLKLRLRILHLFFAVLFLLAVAVQYNDPDPLRWMAIYGVAAVISAVAAFRRIRWAWPALVALVALVWAATLLPAVARNAQTGGLFNQWGMANIGIEEGRELYGLAIVAAWMIATAVHEGRRS